MNLWNFLKYFKLQRINRLWIPSLGRTYAAKSDDPPPPIRRLRVFRRGRFY